MRVELGIGIVELRRSAPENEVRTFHLFDREPLCFSGDSSCLLFAAGGVDQFDGEPLPVDQTTQRIACRSGNVGNNRRVTIERALNSVLLPAFGRPARTIRFRAVDCIRELERCCKRSGTSRAAASRARLVTAHERNVLIDEIESRFEIREQIQKIVPHGREAAPRCRRRADVVPVRAVSDRAHR